MSFQFTKKDDFEHLDPAIKALVPKIITNRINEFDQAMASFKTHDFEQICSYCHKVEGVAVCYGLYQLDEIIRYIHQLAKAQNSGELDAVVSILKAYFDSKK